MFMNARVYFILAFTFITGVFSGGYLYITSFAPDYVQSDVEEISEIEFRVNGQISGGCQMIGVCPSFVLNQDRTYEYIPAYRLEDAEPEVVAGKMSREAFVRVMAVVEIVDFAALQKENTLSCSSYVDGLDYEYQVTYEGEAYSLRTCGMNFKNSSLDKVLKPLWEQLSVVQVEESSNTYGLLEGYLRKSFQRED